MALDALESSLHLKVSPFSNLILNEKGRKVLHAPSPFSLVLLCYCSLAFGGFRDFFTAKIFFVDDFPMPSPTFQTDGKTGDGRACLLLPALTYETGQVHNDAWLLAVSLVGHVFSASRPVDIFSITVRGLPDSR